MTYDVDETPRSVEIQERIEEHSDVIHYLITRGILVGVILLVAYDVITSSEPVDGATSFALSVTPYEIVLTFALLLSLAVFLGAVTWIHEQLHAAALRSLGVSPWIEIDWPEIQGREIYAAPNGGQAGAKGKRKQLALTWLENAYVSLIPLVIPVVVLGIGTAIQLTYKPLTFSSEIEVWILVGLTFLFFGPSPIDWGLAFTSPRYRYEAFVGVERAIERHSIAEGISA